MKDSHVPNDHLLIHELSFDLMSSLVEAPHLQRNIALVSCNHMTGEVFGLVDDSGW